MKRVELIKLKDDVFNGNHPNGINEGYKTIGFEIEPPTLGERYCVKLSKFARYPFSTSIVTKLPDKNGIFKTKYSTYQLKYI